jgi:hypothetical protein
MSFYKYFAALLLFIDLKRSRHPEYFNVSKTDGDSRVQSTIIFVEINVY